MFGRRGTDSAAAFLHRLSEKYDLPVDMYLVDGDGHLITVSRLGLSDQFMYIE